MRLLAMAALLAGALLAPAGPACGHAVVLETVPADGAVLDRAPSAVIVRFSELVTPIAAQVLDGEGKNVLPADAMIGAGDTLRVTLPAALPDGSYVASYRVVSVDSHPIGGSLVFTIGAASRLAPGLAGHEREWGWRTLLLALKVALYTGLLGGAGGALFVLLVRPEGAAAAGAARCATAFATAGGIVALLAIGAEGGLLLAAPPGDLVGLELWQAGLQSTFGRSAVTAACGLALIAAALRRHPTIAGLGAAAALASLALTGHVVTAGPQWLTVPVLIVHASAAAFWLGSLLPLHHVIGALKTGAVPLVRRFSLIALVAVPVLIAAGTVIAILQVGSFDALFATAYGRVLIAKLALLAALLALAALNKLRFTPALERGEASAPGALRRSIRAEIALAAAILVATAALGTTPPPRVTAESAAHDAHMHREHGHGGRAVALRASLGDLRAELTIAPGASGPNRIDIRLEDAAGSPVEARELSVALANPGGGVEPLRRGAERIGPANWRVDNVTLSPSGRWTLRLEILASDFEKPILEAEFELR